MPQQVDRLTLMEWIVDALRHHGGKAHWLAVYKHIWQNHRQELEASGDFFFKWQYDGRWSAQELRKKGVLKTGKESPKGIWELV